MTTDQPSDDAPILNHVGLATTDLERAVAFYTTVLGFSVDRRITMPDEPSATLLGVTPPLGLELAYLCLGPFVLELMHFNREGNPERSERVMNEPGLTHFSISVADIEATAAQVEAHGGSVVTRLPNAIMVRDPDGQLLELLTMGYRRYLAKERAARSDE